MKISEVEFEKILDSLCEENFIKVNEYCPICNRNQDILSQNNYKWHLHKLRAFEHIRAICFGAKITKCNHDFTCSKCGEKGESL